MERHELRELVEDALEALKPRYQRTGTPFPHRPMPGRGHEKRRHSNGAREGGSLAWAGGAHPRAKAAHHARSGVGWRADLAEQDHPHPGALPRSVRP